MNQSSVFRDGEGDAWFKRNQAALDASRGPDWIEFLIERLAGRELITSLCDLGCANGWRLARIARLLAPGARLAGLDASGAAIANGRDRYKGVELWQGLIHEPPFLEGTTFDLVTLSFVLHWVDRSNFSCAIAAVDRLVAQNGYLVLADFLPDHPERRAYHHLPGQDVWTYKQDYAQAFLGLGLYQEIARVTFAHGAIANENGPQLAAIPSAERCGATLLWKSDKGNEIT